MKVMACQKSYRMKKRSLKGDKLHLESRDGSGSSSIKSAANSDLLNQFRVVQQHKYTKFRVIYDNQSGCLRARGVVAFRNCNQNKKNVTFYSSNICAFSVNCLIQEGVNEICRKVSDVYV